MSFSVWYVNISRHAVVQKKYVSTDHSRNSSSVEFGIFVLFQQVGSLRAPGLCRRVQGSVTSAAFDPISQYFLHKKMFSSFSCSVPSPTFLWVLPGVSFFFPDPFLFVQLVRIVLFSLLCLPVLRRATRIQHAGAQKEGRQKSSKIKLNKNVQQKRNQKFG